MAAIKVYSQNVENEYNMHEMIKIQGSPASFAENWKWVRQKRDINSNKEKVLKNKTKIYNWSISFSHFRNLA